MERWPGSRCVLDRLPPDCHSACGGYNLPRPAASHSRRPTRHPGAPRPRSQHGRRPRPVPRVQSPVHLLVDRDLPLLPDRPGPAEAARRRRRHPGDVVRVVAPVPHLLLQGARPERRRSTSTPTVQKDFEGKTNPATGKPYTNEELPAAVAVEAQKRLNADREQWKVLDSLAGPGGRLRRCRGTSTAARTRSCSSPTSSASPAVTWWDQSTGYLRRVAPGPARTARQAPLPVAKIISPGVSPLTRLYLFLILLSNVAVWAFCGGVITRIAAVQLANKGPISLRQAVRFVCKRYLGYLVAPLVPLIIIAHLRARPDRLRPPGADPVRRRHLHLRPRPAGHPARRGRDGGLPGRPRRLPADVPDAQRRGGPERHVRRPEPLDQLRRTSRRGTTSGTGSWRSSTGRR